MDNATPTRRTGVIVWCAIAGGLTTFAVVATVVGPRTQNQESAFIARIAVAMAVLLVASSRVVPRRVQARDLTPGSVAMTRTIIAAALCEGAGLFGCIAWILTGSTWAPVAVAIALAGLLLALPTEARWRELGGQAGGAAPSRPNRLVR